MLDLISLFQMLFGLFGIAIFLIVPGYLMCLALFPLKTDFSFLERFVVSVGFSVSMLSFLFFFISQFFSVKITFFVVACSALLFSVFWLMLYFGRVKRLLFPKFFYEVFSPVEKSNVIEIIPKLK